MTMEACTKKQFIGPRHKLSFVFAKTFALLALLKPIVNSEQSIAASPAKGRSSRRCEGEVGTEDALCGWPCWSKGKEPYLKHGKYRNTEFMLNYPLSSEFFRDLEPPSLFDSLEGVLHRLVVGGNKNVEIVLIGGSMPFGKDCVQEVRSAGGGIRWVENNACSWAARFSEWINHAFPATNIKFVNLAQGGMSAAYFAVDIGNFLNPSTDLVIIDTFVNDYAHLSDADKALTAMADNDTAYGSSSSAIALESLVRTIRKSYPSAKILDTLLMPRWSGIFEPWRFETARRAHQIIMAYYNVPIYDLTAVIEQHPLSWPTSMKVSHLVDWKFEYLKNRGKPHLPKNTTAEQGMRYFVNTVHPHWTSHQLIADILGNLIAKTWLRLCRNNNVTKIVQIHTSKTALRPPINTRQSLAAYDGCSNVLTRWTAKEVFAARHTDGYTGSEPTVKVGNWSLYEDVPGKAGWISTEQNSEITFPIRVGADPKISVTYLRTYCDSKCRLGTAGIILDGVGIPVDLDRLGRNKGVVHLRGEWSQKFSQGVSFLATARTLGVMRKVRANTTINLTIRLESSDGLKFKILGVTSC